MKKVNRIEEILKIPIQQRIMDAAFEFDLNGDNIEFATDLIRTGRTVPAALFIDILTEKCQLIARHLCTTRDYLVIMASVTNTMASITFYDTYLEDSEIRHVTLSNLPDLEGQLIHLWTEVCDILRTIMWMTTMLSWPA